ncbi:MAG: dihydroxyacetone kinase phosphoryl donor subunit DhaM [Clostridiaceae bacterium]|nr:dihydroxyacetone kinase phosphoryl donor subunit DhaM [Clostridiaceae bacterium]
MVGIVVVSHSAKIAEGIKDITKQIADKNLKIIAAGGMADGAIGTDAVIISEAVLEANTGDGVVILVDLGSTVLSTYMALELLDESVQKSVRIADAPIVEGAISAVVQATVDSSVDEVVAVTEEARNISKL